MGAEKAIKSVAIIGAGASGMSQALSIYVPIILVAKCVADSKEKELSLQRRSKQRTILIRSEYLSGVKLQAEHGEFPQIHRHQLG